MMFLVKQGQSYHGVPSKTRTLTIIQWMRMDVFPFVLDAGCVISICLFMLGTVGLSSK